LQTTSIHNTFNTHIKLAHYLSKGSCKYILEDSIESAPYI